MNLLALAVGLADAARSARRWPAGGAGAVAAAAGPYIASLSHHVDRFEHRPYPHRAANPHAKAFAPPQRRRRDKNAPLVQDIRLLGRILGQVIREQEGAQAYELIENIRRLSVAYRLKRDHTAGRDLTRLLEGLSADQTVSVIRAFSYFSHLANIAEDRHHVRRRHHHERAGHKQAGSLATSFERLEQAGVRPAQVAATLARAHISPVLTAHPTEVQRKSILDAEFAIARLVGERDGLDTERERKTTRRRCAQGSHSCGRRACCATPSSLWPTRSRTRCRTTRPPSCARCRGCTPRSNARCRGTRWRRSFAWATGSAAIATATPTSAPHTLRCALARQAEVALRFYLTEVHELGAELSISQTLAPVTDAMQALAERSPDRNPHREDEPYRRALTGMYARLAATLQRLTGTEALRHAVAPQDPYRSADELLGDLQVIEASLRHHHAEALIAPRLKPLQRAVQVFGFHLATLDLRQSATSTRR